MKRRTFITHSGIIGIGFAGLSSLMKSCDQSSSQIKWTGEVADEILSKGYGPLIEDKEGILNLPKGFSYKIISRKGEKMIDGLLVPGLADGMATFPGSDGRVIIIRNHEVSPKDKGNGPFGADMNLLSLLQGKDLYDFGSGKYPCLGGTTTMVYDPGTNLVESQYLSLAGTIRNCAGGATPWNSWISCEESVEPAGSILEQNHGYNFEVPASESPILASPTPIKAMGRFNHEAVCVDPKTSIVYQTEDRPDGLIYRYIPIEPGVLSQGGRLQVLAIKGQEQFDTRNWDHSKNSMEIGRRYEVTWIDIDEIDAPEDRLRYRGFDGGAAVFARGEGAWFGDGEFYFACTNGGRKASGQVFRYIPSTEEGKTGEENNPGTLELFIEPNNSNLLESCDNLTIGSNGHLVLCEDQAHPRIIGVTPEGKIYHIAENIGYESEFAGATFSPDGSILFVNIQGPGLTLAIRGPWGSV